MAATAAIRRVTCTLRRALYASLATPLNSGKALGDTYTSIENLFGSRFNDHLTGNNVSNILDGGFGGNDTMRGDLGADTFNFHGGATTITDFNKAEGDKINLFDFTAPRGRRVDRCVNRGALSISVAG